MNETLRKQQHDEPGLKFDGDKSRIDLIPPEALFAAGHILAGGAEKYSARNWEKGMSWGRVFGATMRHMWAWWAGKGPTTKSFAFGDLDLETGHSHLWHALTCVMFLVAFEERGIGKDDRLGSENCPTRESDEEITITGIDLGTSLSDHALDALVRGSSLMRKTEG